MRVYLNLDPCRLIISMVFALAALPAFSQAAPEVIRLPLIVNGKPTEVVAHLYKPAGDGPFPLVIYSHGRAGTRVERAQLERPIAVGHGNFWLKKGVAVIAPVRPGYGDTGGTDVEDSGAQWRDGQCFGLPDFTTTSLNARRTVVATYDWALMQPWVRKDRLLIEGQSVGGLTSVAVSALNLPGVRGIVNFAGGAGGNPSSSPGKSCEPDVLTKAYRQFGEAAKAPSLWLYAENDLYWGAEAPKRWFEAYKVGGSDAELLQTGPVEGHDGHQLLLRGGAMWSKPLSEFARKVGLLGE